MCQKRLYTQVCQLETKTRKVTKSKPKQFVCIHNVGKKEPTYHSSRIDNVGCKVYFAKADRFGVSILDRWIIAIIYI